jgi:hypothetical protein
MLPTKSRPIPEFGQSQALRAVSRDACIPSPVGDILAGPLYDAEGILTVDCDLREALHAKRCFDVVGHYGRADVLAPHPHQPAAS